MATPHGHEPNFDNFLHVLLRDRRPQRLPFYEHVVTGSFIDEATGVPFTSFNPKEPGYWETYVDFWMGLGFDEVPIEVPPALPLGNIEAGSKSHGSEARALIRDWDDFERYPWPDEENSMDFWHYERVAELLPDGAKMVAGLCMGPYEWVSSLLGVEGLSLALYTDPDLVAAVFGKIKGVHVSVLKRLASMDAVGALRQGDDLGFKTSTFLSPAHLREHVFPIYKAMADVAHDAGKPFLLHSCGNLGEVYDDIIDGCGIDAKHSFEDVILPVTDFKDQYGDRVTAIGGLDVDTICRANEDELRAYTRRVTEHCFADGFWALGTGNSLTDYMPVQNYRIVLEEGRNVAAAM